MQPSQTNMASKTRQQNTTPQRNNASHPTHAISVMRITGPACMADLVWVCFPNNIRHDPTYAAFLSGLKLRVASTLSYLGLSVFCRYSSRRFLRDRICISPRRVE